MIKGLSLWTKLSASSFTKSAAPFLAKSTAAGTAYFVVPQVIKSINADSLKVQGSRLKVSMIGIKIGLLFAEKFKLKGLKNVNSETFQTAAREYIRQQNHSTQFESQGQKKRKQQSKERYMKKIRLGFDWLPHILFLLLLKRTLKVRKNIRQYHKLVLGSYLWTVTYPLTYQSYKYAAYRFIIPAIEKRIHSLI